VPIQRGGKFLRLQVRRHKEQVLWLRERAPAKLGRGPGKRTRVIDVEYSHIVRKGRLPPGKRIEPGSHNDILTDSTKSRFGQPILGKSASECEQRAQKI